MATGKYKYWITKDGLMQLESWARDGLTDEQIAHNIGIRRPTLYQWKKDYPDISDALKRGKAPVDMEVENALLKSAKGYDYDEQIYRPNSKGKMILDKVVRKHAPPNPTSAIFWLKNRKPEQWREKQTVELNQPLDESVKELHKYLKDIEKSNR